MIDQERKKAASKRFYWRHHKEQLERLRIYRQKPGYKEHKRELLLALKSKALTHYGEGVCACIQCGFDNVKALSIDHIDGRDNVEHSVKRLNGLGMYYWLKKKGYPSGYQTLCMNCQFIKREDTREFSNQYAHITTKKRVSVTV